MAYNKLFDLVYFIIHSFIQSFIQSFIHSFTTEAEMDETFHSSTSQGREKHKRKDGSFLLFPVSNIPLKLLLFGKAPFPLPFDRSSLTLSESIFLLWKSTTAIPPFDKSCFAASTACMILSAIATVLGLFASWFYYLLVVIDQIPISSCRWLQRLKLVFAILVSTWY